MTVNVSADGYGGRAYRDTVRTFLTKLSETLVRIPLSFEKDVPEDEPDAA